MDTKRSQNISKMLSHLIKANNKSQTQVADESQMALGQLNGYLNNKNDIMSKSLIEVLYSLDINLEQIIKSKTQKATSLDELKFETDEDVLLFFYRNLEQIPRQTMLKHISWISTFGNKKLKVPSAASDILNRETAQV
ncbi:MAG: hypothetical protein WA160_06890 [Pseudobdellovibrio sp.]